MFPYGKEALYMKRTVISIALLLAAMLLCLPALADHSVMPGEGIMDETAAVDAAVAFLCQSLGCGEEDIRGKFHYRALIYNNRQAADNPVWGISVIDPTVNEDGETLVSYHYEIDAVSGEVMYKGTSDSTWFVEELRDAPLIPRKDQLQPAEAIDRARAMIREALGLSDDVMKDHWRDYWLDGWNENGENRYRVNVGDPDLMEKAWQAVLDVESGSVVWHTDPLRFAARHAIDESGGYENWVREQQEAYAVKWDDAGVWDYRKWAALEELCFCGLPGEGDCSPEEAMDTIGQYMGRYAGPGMNTEAWSVWDSIFLLNYSGENDPYSMPVYLAGTHVWELLVYFEVTGELALITVDAAAVEVIGDEPVIENGDWSY